MWVVMHDASLGSRALPDGAGGVVLVEPGQAFEVPDAIAGEAPSGWETCPGDVPRGPSGEDLADGCSYEPLQVPVMVDVDGDGEGDTVQVAHYFRRRGLGWGLLAQEDVYRVATDAQIARAGGGADA
jgi:hypothetical protein